MLTDYYFWFVQPSSVLNNYDQILGLVFVILFAVGLLLWAINRFAIKHQIVKKLLRKFVAMNLVVGLSGLLWYGFRYESIPIFARRYWAGLNIIILAIWLAWILKYWIFKFSGEKKEYDDFQLKSKYIPGKK